MVTADRSPGERRRAAAALRHALERLETKADK
jgi:hypothetical protein